MSGPVAVPPNWKRLGDVADQVVRDVAAARLARQDPRFHRLVECLHQLGPRAVGELLLEVGEPDDLLLCLERYADLDQAIVRALGGSEFPQPSINEVP